MKSKGRSTLHRTQIASAPETPPPPMAKDVKDTAFALGDTHAAVAGETPPPAQVSHTSFETPYFFKTGPIKGPGTGDLVGRYRLATQLGEGAAGRVFLAHHVDLPAHKVAIKIMDIEVARRSQVERELLTLASATHPNIVQLTDHGTTERCAWLAMPYYQGKTLSARLETGTLSLREAHDIFVPIAAAVAALHAAGLRHQDIKPDNIFLAQFGAKTHPILLDLGVATARDSHFVAGTPLYAAPEQLAPWLRKPGRSRLTEKMDVYGLGLTLLCALVGPAALLPEGDGDGPDLSEGLAALAALAEPRAKDPLPARFLPDLRGNPRDQLIACLKRWLAPEPKDRPDMETLVAELDVLLLQQREERERVERRQHRRNLALAVLTSLIAVIGLVAFLQRTNLALAAELQQVQGVHKLTTDTLEGCQASHAGVVVRSNALQRDLESRTTEAAQLTTRAAQLATQLGDTQSTLAARQSDLSAKQAELTAKQAELTAKQADLDGANQDLARKQADLDSTRADLEKATSDLTTARKDLEKTRADLQKATQDLSTATAALVQKTTDLDAASRAAEDLRKKLERKEADYTQAIAQRDEAQRARDRHAADLQACNSKPPCPPLPPPCAACAACAPCAPCAPSGPPPTSPPTAPTAPPPPPPPPPPPAPPK